MKNSTRKLQQVAGLSLAAVAMVMLLNVGPAEARSAKVAGKLDYGQQWVFGSLDHGLMWVFGSLDHGLMWVFGSLDHGLMWVFKGRAATSGN